MNKKQASRLLTLAYFLRNLPPEKVKMASWVSLRDVPKAFKEDVRILLEDLSCGTAACAIGWCPTVFPRSWVWDTFYPSLRRVNGDDKIVEMSRKFFGIRWADEWRHLFGSGHKRNAQEEADIIEEFVNSKGWYCEQ